MVMDSDWITAFARVGRVIPLGAGGGGREGGEVARFPLTCCCGVMDDAPCVCTYESLQVIRIKVQPAERLSLCGSPKTPFKFLGFTISRTLQMPGVDMQHDVFP